MILLPLLIFFIFLYNQSIYKEQNSNINRFSIVNYHNVKKNAIYLTLSLISYHISCFQTINIVDRLYKSYKIK